MDKKIDLFQVCYKEEQREKCYPFAKVFFNDADPGLFFENSIIAQLVPFSDADIIGVASWRLADKRADGPVPIILKNKIGLSEDVIRNTDFDVAVLTPRSHKDVRNKLLVWHNCHNALKEFDRFFRIPETVSNVIYENHFLARAEIYKAYVSDCLLPAISFMEGKEVFASDSGYAGKLKKGREVEEYRAKTGRADWPIAPFILERLFCSWIEGKGYKVINL